MRPAHLAGAFALLASSTLALPALAQPARDVTRPPVSSTEAPTVAFAVDPFSAVLGRYGADFQILPGAHQGFMINLHFDHASAASSTADGRTLEGRIDGQGAELGYRLYAGSDGCSGFFIGPSLLLARHTLRMTDRDPVSLGHVGWAIDAGVQTIYASGFLLSFGVGVQHADSGKELPKLPSFALGLLGEGWFPRVLFSVGFAG